MTRAAAYDDRFVVLVTDPEEHQCSVDDSHKSRWMIAGAASVVRRR
jgi:hypothetical protein